jgi:DNA polymerase III sliding clamp (beta) subunit (PCNA family)
VREEVATAYNGEPMEVIFNPDYLLDGVVGIAGDQFVFGVNRNAEKPSVLCATEGRDYQYLVMPMRA